MSQDIKDSLASRIGMLSAAVTGSSLIASAFYDWGFFFSIGIGFAEAPTTIADHLRSWLVWLPKVALTILAILLVEMSTRRIERGMTEDEIVALAPDPKKTEKSRTRPFRFLVVVAILGVIVWLIIGGPTTYIPLASGIILWFVISGWIFSHPIVNQRHSTWFQSIFHWGPPVLAFFFYMGFSSAQSAMSNSGTTHKLHIANNAVILRHFEEYLLVRNRDETIMWIRTDSVRAIEQTVERSPFPGIACYLQESWCLGSRIAKPAE